MTSSSVRELCGGFWHSGKGAVARLSAAGRDWGSSADERTLGLPCDAYLPAADAVLHRALDVLAQSGLVYRWLYQLRAAPYSYDLIDNRGRRSPRTLTPGLDSLAAGQRIAGVLRVLQFTPGESITMGARWRSLAFVATYAVRSLGPARSRLLVRVRLAYPRTQLGRLLARVLPAGDLVMMRKQLCTLAALAERDHRVGRTRKTSVRAL
jgi:hypothetical protein